MRGFLALVVGTIGALVLIAVLVGIAADEDNSTKIVTLERWTEDTCGTVATYKGQLEAIGDDLRRSRPGLRDNDCGSGDHVEASVDVRDAIDRALQGAGTLQEGLLRAGIPDAREGGEASLILRTWAQELEDDLRASQVGFDDSVADSTLAYDQLRAATAALGASIAEGRRAYQEVLALDSAYEDAFTGERACNDLEAVE
jgi:hypothetical protein